MPVITCPSCGKKSLIEDGDKVCPVCSASLSSMIMRIENERRTEESRTGAAQQKNTSLADQDKTMQRWDYKLIVYNRGWHQEEKANFMAANNWSMFWTELERQLVQLGSEGWELVSVVPTSDYLGGVQSTVGGYPYAGDYAGFTTSLLWILKRPRP
jgi:uncharacterized Zn finger protein (UPF0148 family)